MNRFTKYVWIALVVAAAGCSKDDRDDRGAASGSVPGAEAPVPEGMAVMTLDLSADGRLTASGPASKADTRAASPDETAVGDMWMLQFDTEASAEGSLMHRAYVPAQDISQSGSALTAPVMLRQSANCVIVVVANAPESFTAAVLPDGAKLTELRARTFAVRATVGTSLPADNSPRLPMFGETEQIAVSLVGSQSVPVKLTRLASRMSLTLVNSFTSGYPRLELTSVTLRNAPTKIAYGPLTETTTYLGDVYPEAEESNFRDYTPVTAGFAGTVTSYVWYIAPNRRGTGTATAPEDKSALTAPEGQGSYCTYISIAGKLTRTEGAAAKDVTYNVYLGANNTNDYNLWANAAYSARLVITGFNEEILEVGYEGFGITVAPMDGIADNTITGWHPDSGLDYVPAFLAFAPYRIDFGDAESPEAQTVTFRINSKWRFSYTSGDAAKVVASSSAAANTDQTGGAQGENAECEVTFAPVIYKAQSGTPAAGTQYNAVATFATVGGSITDTRTTVLLRTVPTFYGEPAVFPAPGTLPRAGETLTATMISNARWSFAVSPGSMVTQEPDSYASRTLEVAVPVNNTWKSRTVKAVVEYGESMKEWNYTQPGMYISGATITPDPSKGIPGVGTTYTVAITGDCGTVAVRAICDGQELVRAYGSSDKPAEVKVPANLSHDNRIVIFQYQENGVWMSLSRGTQVPGYGVTSAAVSPAGDIPKSGGRYTVTLSGMLPLEGVEVRAAVNGTAIATGKVTASGRGQVLNIPANNDKSERTVVFEYLWNGVWTTIDSREQLPVPQVTRATVSPAGDIPYGGGRYTVTLEGFNFGDGIQVRALSSSELASGVVSASGSTAALNIPANTGVSNRTVTFQYNLNGSWTTIERKPQLPTLQITKATLGNISNGKIKASGQGVYVTLWGAFPAGGVDVRARLNSGEILSEETVYTSGGRIELMIPANTTKKDRNISFEYNWNGHWMSIDYLPQPWAVELYLFHGSYDYQSTYGACEKKGNYRDPTLEEWSDKCWQYEFVLRLVQGPTNRWRTIYYNGTDNRLRGTMRWLYNGTVVVEDYIGDDLQCGIICVKK